MNFGGPVPHFQTNLNHSIAFFKKTLPFNSPTKLLSQCGIVVLHQNETIRIYIYIYIHTVYIYPNSVDFPSYCTWLVVSAPLENISQLGLLFPIYGKNVPNHQPDTLVRNVYSVLNCFQTCFSYIPIICHYIAFPLEVPKKGVTLNHPFQKVFHYKPSTNWGTTIYGNPHICISPNISPYTSISSSTGS